MPGRTLAAVLIFCGVFTSASPADASARDKQQEKAIELFSASPVVFIENAGQIEDQRVRYVFYGDGANIFHTTEGPVFELFKKEQAVEKDGIKRNRNSLRCSYGITVRFIGAKCVEPVGTQTQQVKVNYFIGNDPQRWQKDVATYAEVVYPELYEGIDLHTFGSRSHLKYEFHVSPGVDYSQITIRYEGTNWLWTDSDGTLHIETPMGELVDNKPYIYQVVDGRQVEIKGRYRPIDETSYSFEVSGEIDGSRELIIDPDLAWSSYLGGSNYDYGYGIAVDDGNNCLITGSTYSANFPVPDGFDRGYSNGGDVFVAKVSGNGQLVWASYLGGSGGEAGNDIAVDDANNCLITGVTNSTNFPASGGFDTSHNGYDDAFVAKIKANGSQLLWASYLGGSGYDEGYGIAVDKEGACRITGRTSSTNFPVSGGFDTSYNGGVYDAFVTKVTSGGLLAWSSYLGGSGYEWSNDVAVDDANNCLIAGETNSANFPVSGGFDMSYNAIVDVFVAKVTNSCSLAWASYLGGNGDDRAYGIAVDSAGNCLITGQTDASNFPTSGGFDTSYNGGTDAFVAKVKANGSQLLWASYLGGSGNDCGNGIAVNNAGDCMIVGETSSTNFPVPRGFDRSYNGGADTFVAKVTSGGQFAWSSYLGGSGYDEGHGIAVDHAGNCLIAGETASTNFPVPNGFDPNNNGQEDAFVVKVDVSAMGTGDFSRDGFVDFDDFVQLAAYWLASCNSPNWCDGCDVDGSGKVNFCDFNAIAGQWLEETY